VEFKPKKTKKSRSSQWLNPKQAYEGEEECKKIKN